MAENSIHYRAGRVSTNRCRPTSHATVGMLPDGVLLEIFDCYVTEAKHDLYQHKYMEVWYTLVHVCRRWRTVVLGSPCRLNLHLVCRSRTPVKGKLDLWPPLPIAVWFLDRPSDEDNIVAALEHNDRVCDIYLRDISGSLFEKVVTSMQQPFPALTDLQLQFGTRGSTDVPDSFLSGSAPRLQTLELWCFPFPGLPNLLCSATNLVTLRLCDIPRSGLISPEAMVTCLSALTKLENLVLGSRFRKPRYREERLSPPPPPPRSVFPALTDFSFKGYAEYLEDLVAGIDAPCLNDLSITFISPSVLHTPEIAQFISRTPNFSAPEKACLIFYESFVCVMLPSRTFGYREPHVNISYSDSHWPYSSLMEVCALPLPSLFTVKHLFLYEDKVSQLDWQDQVKNSLWRRLLRPFIAVEDLYLSEGLGPRITPALQELDGEGATEMLPALQNIFLEGPRPYASGPVQEDVEKFVAARQAFSHPIAVCPWDREWDIW